MVLLKITLMQLWICTPARTGLVDSDLKYARVGPLLCSRIVFALPHSFNIILRASSIIQLKLWEAARLLVAGFTIGNLKVCKFS